MPKQDSIEVEGRVTEPLPNAMFRWKSKEGIKCSHIFPVE